MKEKSPSATALRVAARRAAHQLIDDPKIFDDPLALRILGIRDGAAPDPPDPHWLGQDRFSRGLRAFLAARSRWVEDELHRSVEGGVRQYVVLGAGLDTFAFRNPYPAETLCVFEVDHPDTQHGNASCWPRPGIPIPPSVTFVPVDFETQNPADRLGEAGLDTGAPAFFSWLGVTQYLTEDAVTATLRFVATMPRASSIVFDYTVAPSTLAPAARAAFDFLAARVATDGEPFRSFFDPSALAESLAAMGFGETRDVTPEELNALYFQRRADGLKTGGFTHIMNARV